MGSLKRPKATLLERKGTLRKIAQHTLNKQRKQVVF